MEALIHWSTQPFRQLAQQPGSCAYIREAWDRYVLRLTTNDAVPWGTPVYRESDSATDKPTLEAASSIRRKRQRDRQTDTRSGFFSLKKATTRPKKHQFSREKTTAPIHFTQSADNIYREKESETEKFPGVHLPIEKATARPTTRHSKRLLLSGESDDATDKASILAREDDCTHTLYPVCR